MPKVGKPALSFCMIALSAISFCSVHESRDSLFGLADENALKRLRTGPFAIPDTLGHRDIVLITTMGASFQDVLLLGPSSDDPKELAIVLDDWQKDKLQTGEDVEWSKEEGYACARLTISHGRLGSRSDQTSSPLGVLVRRLKERYQMSGVLRVSRGATLHEKMVLGDRARGYYSYDLSTAQPGFKVTVSRSLTNLDVAMTAAFFGLIDFFVLFGFLIAFVVARSPKIPIQRRRKLYATFALRTTFVAIGIHACLAFFFIQSPTLRAAADLWFGTWRVSVMTLPIFLGILPLFAVLPIMGRVEAKIFGPANTNELLQSLPKQPIVVSDEEMAFRKKQLRLGFIIGGIGMSLLMVTLFALPPSARAFGSLLRLFGMAIAIFSQNLAKLILRSQASEFDGPVESQKLNEIAKDIATRMDTRFGRIFVERAPLYRNLISARISPSGNIGVSQRALDELTDDELTFLVAHEIGHRKQGHFKQMLLLAIPCLLLADLPFISIFMGQMGFERPVWWTPFTFASAILGFMAFFLGIKRLRLIQEYQADSLALRTTRNGDAAISLLKKSVASSGLPHLHDVEVNSTHPAVSKRIAAIEKLSRTNGFQLQSDISDAATV